MDLEHKRPVPFIPIRGTGSAVYAHPQRAGKELWARAASEEETPSDEDLTSSSDTEETEDEEEETEDDTEDSEEEGDESTTSTDISDEPITSSSTPTDSFSDDEVWDDLRHLPKAKRRLHQLTSKKKFRKSSGESSLLSADDLRRKEKKMKRESVPLFLYRDQAVGMDKKLRSFENDTTDDSAGLATRVLSFDDLKDKARNRKKSTTKRKSKATYPPPLLQSLVRTIKFQVAQFFAHS